jgi:hypothetical protein
MENFMTTETFINQLASGQTSDAKETLVDLLSARAFEALEGRKQELATSLFGNQVADAIEQAKETQDQ